MTEIQTEPQFVHFLASINIVVPAPGLSGGRVTQYGQDLRLTQEIRDLNTDRVGRCLFDLDEQQQLAKFGRPIFRLSATPWPADEPRIEAGSQRWWDERESLRQAAWLIQDEQLRADRLRLIEATYGTPTTSQTLGSFS